MRNCLKYLSIIGAAASLMACVHTGQHSAPSAVSASMTFANADQAYLIGRGDHLAQRFDAAIAAYGAALKLAPSHINARNGLATVYAEQGRFDKAIALWKTLTGELSESGPAEGPHSAFLFSNLGYAMFLSGDYDGALAALEKACVLDPLNHRAWQHLGNALDKLGQHERALAMHKQAAALKTHDFKADYAAAGRAGVGAIDSAIAAADMAADTTAADWDETQIEQSANGMFVMRRVSAKPGKVIAAAPLVTAPAPAPEPVHRNPGMSSRLEISNGNGITGMARSLSRTMGDHEWRVVRLSNQKGFGVATTRVEYQAEFQEAAARLAARFGAAQVVRVSSGGHADLRLVIGRDLIATTPARLPLTANAATSKTRG